MLPFPTLFALAIAPPPPSPDWDALKLPRAVRLSALGYNNGEDEPFDRIIAEIGPDWVRSEQHLSEGAFGFRLFDLTHDTTQESLTFNTASNRGRRTKSFQVARISRTEGIVTPLGFIRVAKHYQHNGGVFKASLEGENVVYAFALPPETGLSRVELVIDSESYEMREVRLPGDAKSGLARYSEWRQLPDGTRHPMKIVSISEYRLRDRNGVSTRESRVESMELLDPARGPTGYDLPASAQVIDEVRRVIAEGPGMTTGALPSTPASPAIPSALTQSRFPWELLVVAVGSLLIVIAGVAWRRKACNSG